MVVWAQSETVHTAKCDDDSVMGYVGLIDSSDDNLGRIRAHISGVLHLQHCSASDFVKGPGISSHFRVLGPISFNSGWHNALRFALGLVDKVIELGTSHVCKILVAHRMCDGKCKYFIVGDCIKEVTGVTGIGGVVFVKRHKFVLDGCDLVLRKKCHEVLIVW